MNEKALALGALSTLRFYYYYFGFLSEYEESFYYNYYC